MNIDVSRYTTAGDTGIAQVVQAIKNVAASVGNLSTQVRESRQENGEAMKDIYEQLSGLQGKARVLFAGGGGGVAGGDGKAFPLRVAIFIMYTQ